MPLIKVLSDTSLMPFGKHKHLTMANVPADYLLWLNDQKPLGTDDDRAVREYIKDNMDVLRFEQKRAKLEGRNPMFNPYQ